jgi:hypothetical protein
MGEGKLKRSSESPVAAKIRDALDVGPDEEVQIVTPQFERPAGEPPPMSAPTSIAEFNALKTMTDAQRQHLGLRRWGRPEDEDMMTGNSASPRKSRRPDLTGAPMLWLFPSEWYDHIPDGYEVVSISYYVEKFERGVSDNDIRYGCLPYGILVRDSS